MWPNHISIFLYIDYGYEVVHFPIKHLPSTASKSTPSYRTRNVMFNWFYLFRCKVLYKITAEHVTNAEQVKFKSEDRWLKKRDIAFFQLVIVCCLSWGTIAKNGCPILSRAFSCEHDRSLSRNQASNRSTWLVEFGEPGPIDGNCHGVLRRDCRGDALMGGVVSKDRSELRQYHWRHARTSKFTNFYKRGSRRRSTV